MIQILLNGQTKAIPDKLSLGDLLRQLNLDPLKVAVAKNLEVMLRSDLDQTFMRMGDEIEIFQAVGGG